MKRRPWWSTWSAALALGALSLVMVGATVMPLLLVAAMPEADVSGTDLAAGEDLRLGWRIAYSVLGVALLGVPVGVVVCARKMWLGWMLVSLLASAVILGAVLWTLGII